jgi:hypothetical protein
MMNELIEVGDIGPCSNLCRGDISDEAFDSIVWWDEVEEDILD